MDYVLDILDSVADCFVKPNTKATSAPPTAGCVFTDGTYMLAGYQPNKNQPRISGLGGKALNGESYITAAIRETLEELFEINPAPLIIQDIQMYLIPQRTIQNESHTMLEYSFEDLHCMLDILRTHQIQSPLYNTMPKNITELIFRRNINPKAEVSHLALLPMVHHEGTDFVGKEVLSDIKLLLLENE
jgi:hypothetical protein